MTVGSPLTKQRSTWERIEEMDINGARACAWQRKVSDGSLRALVAQEPLGPDGELQWHMSISHATNHAPPRYVRYPTWDEIAHARYELLPADKTFAMLLPPPSEYVAVHPTTFHLHEIAEQP